jgi:hypothetical protein
MSVQPTSLAPTSPGPEAEPEEMSASTQPPYKEADFSVDSAAGNNSDDNDTMPVDITIDLTVDSPVKAALPQAEDLVSEESIQPLQAALLLLSSYMKTLRFKEQQDTFSDFGTAFIRKFATYYHVSKSILVLQDDLMKAPSSCKVSIPFSPLDAISEGMACKAFIRKLAEATAKLQLSAIEYYLKGKCLNNKARKQELIEIFAIALPVQISFWKMLVSLPSKHMIWWRISCNTTQMMPLHISMVWISLHLLRPSRRSINVGEKLSMAGKYIVSVSPKIVPSWKHNLWQL